MTNRSLTHGKATLPQYNQGWLQRASPDPHPTRSSSRAGQSSKLEAGRARALQEEPTHASCALTAMHCRMMQLCFMRPGPPNFFMSLQKWHSPHSVRRHASHLRHRVRRRRAPAVVRLAANFTAEAGPSLPFGRPTTRFWWRIDRTMRWEVPG